MLDHTAYPHIWDLILDYAPYCTFNTLRCTSRALNQRFERQLAHHVMVSPGDLQQSMQVRPGVNLVAPTSAAGRLPMFQTLQPADQSFLPLSTVRLLPSIPGDRPGGLLNAKNLLAQVCVVDMLNNEDDEHYYLPVGKTSLVNYLSNVHTLRLRTVIGEGPWPSAPRLVILDVTDTASFIPYDYAMRLYDKVVVNTSCARSHYFDRGAGGWQRIEAMQPGPPKATHLVYNLSNIPHSDMGGFSNTSPPIVPEVHMLLMDMLASMQVPSTGPLPPIICRFTIIGANTRLQGMLADALYMADISERYAPDDVFEFATLDEYREMIGEEEFRLETMTNLYE